MEAIPGGGGVVIDVFLLEYPEEQILNSFSKGYRSQVTYTVKIYEQNTGFFSFLGDRILSEYTIARIAGWDQFSERFFYTDADGRRKTFFSKKAFFENFFTLHNYPVKLPKGRSRQLYSLVGVEIEPVHLIPPLTIINMLNRKNIIHSGWKRVPL